MLPALHVAWFTRMASVPGAGRASPAEPVVDAKLRGMLVIAKTSSHDGSGSTGEIGAAEIIVLVLSLGRPVRREHVFETATDGVAVIVVSIGCKPRWRSGNRHTDIRVVAPCVAALGVEQRRTPGVPEPAGDRAELVVMGGHERVAREEHTAVTVREPTVLGFRAHHPVCRELIVEAALRAAQKSCAASFQAIIAAECAAEMSADIEAGPVVDGLRRRIDRSLCIRPRRYIRRERGSCECEKGSSAEQNFPH